MMNFPDNDGPAPASSSLFSSTSPSMDQFGSGSNFPTGAGGINPQEAAELQQFLEIEQEKAKLRSQVQAMTDMCWDKCLVQPSNKTDSKTETCLDNCAQRFVDVSFFITHRFANLLQRQGGG